jgi:hypothetical protein
VTGPADAYATRRMRMPRDDKTLIEPVTLELGSGTALLA